MLIKGPAVIAENATTTLVTPIQQLTVDIYGNLIITML
jgi:N-methylhydantoinase A